MVWGGFIMRGVLKLVFLPRGQSFNNTFYRKKVLKPMFEELSSRTEETDDITTTSLFEDPDEWNPPFSQDGARPHTANATIALLDQKCPDYIENWPANSPDLNLIENLWAILTEVVYQVDIKTRGQLIRRVRHAWRNLDPNILQNLVKDMKHRIQELVDAGGKVIDR